MALFRSNRIDKQKLVLSKDPLDPGWVRDERGRFVRFVDLDPEDAGLTGVSGVYILWHKGVKPAWVTVGRTDNLATTLHRLAKDRHIMEYEVNGGLYVAWSFIKPEYQAGVAKFLAQNLRLKSPNPELAADDETPIPVTPPGAAV